MTDPDLFARPLDIETSVNWLKNFGTDLGLEPETMNGHLVDVVDAELRLNGKTVKAIRESVELLDQLSFRK